MPESTPGEIDVVTLTMAQQDEAIVANSADQDRVRQREPIVWKETEENPFDDPQLLRVRDWRHKVQKAFLGRIPLTDDDVPSMHALFTIIEHYEGMTASYLKWSKIHKVMRHVCCLEEDKVSGNAEFHFRERAWALLEKWNPILQADGRTPEPIPNPTT